MLRVDGLTFLTQFYGGVVICGQRVTDLALMLKFLSVSGLCGQYVMSSLYYLKKPLFTEFLYMNRVVLQNPVIYCPIFFVDVPESPCPLGWLYLMK